MSKETALAILFDGTETPKSKQVVLRQALELPTLTGQLTDGPLTKFSGKGIIFLSVLGINRFKTLQVSLNFLPRDQSPENANIS